MDRRAVADVLAAGRGGFAIERGGQEDLAAGRVELEHLGRIRREAEAVVLGPDADLVGAAAQDRDVERVDRDFHEDLGAVTRGRGATRARRGRTRGPGVGLDAEPLERPVAALLDARRYPGEWRETAEGATATGELERGDVVLHPVVVSGERRRPEQVDGPIGTDEPAAGQSGGRSHRDQEEPGDQGAAGSVDRTHSSILLGSAGPELGPVRWG